MFSKVASRYDIINDIFSMGIHHIWKNKLIHWSHIKVGDSVLDCATGTGDLAIKFKRLVGPSGHVLGTDFCESMLNLARIKATKQNCEIQFEVADVTNLPYANEKFSCASIAFGIRNVANPAKGISELARATKSQGTVMVLEFGQPTLPIFKSIYSLYSGKILPKLGGWLSGDSMAYQYLHESSMKFPCGQEFANIMTSTNSFTKVEYQKLWNGIAYLYRGIKK